MSKVQIVLFVVPKVVAILSDVGAAMKKKSDGGKKITATERKKIVDDAVKEFRELVSFQFFGVSSKATPQGPGDAVTEEVDES